MNICAATCTHVLRVLLPRIKEQISNYELTASRIRLVDDMPSCVIIRQYNNILPLLIIFSFYFIAVMVGVTLAEILFTGVRLA